MWRWWEANIKEEFVQLLQIAWCVSTAQLWNCWTRTDDMQEELIHAGGTYDKVLAEYSQRTHKVYNDERGVKITIRGNCSATLSITLKASNKHAEETYSSFCGERERSLGFGGVSYEYIYIWKNYYLVLAPKISVGLMSHATFLLRH